MRKALITERADTDLNVLIEPEVFITINKYRQKSKASTEAGGILLGYRKGRFIHITSVTTPQENDKRARFAFIRSDNYHQTQAMKAWKQSGGYIDYLGEWHTHPESSPTPSAIDVTEWRKIFKTTNKPMVFLVLGTSNDVWLGYINRVSIVRLS